MSKFWNELVKDGEIVNDRENVKSGQVSLQKGDGANKENLPSALGSSGGDEKAGQLGSTWEDEGRSYQPSSEVINSWTWGEQPTIEGLSEAVRSLMVEQRELTTEATRTTASSIRLHQRLIVLERYYNAYVSCSSVKPLFGFGTDEKEIQRNIGRNAKNVK